MQFVNEIDIDKQTDKLIKDLRNASFPEHVSQYSYYKQLPHIRCLQYDNSQLVGYMGLDYRVIGVNDKPYKILGVIDFCVSEDSRGKGIGSLMLNELTAFAESKEVDFIILMAESHSFYERNGFVHIPNVASCWLRIHEHKNLGMGFEHLNDFFIKPTGDKLWPDGHVDWLGYMF
jgi:GNAT superfamily N-acetyltransferase